MDDIKLPLNSRRATVTIANGDATPSTSGGHLFEGNTNADPITDFDDGQVGDIIHVFSDVTGTNETEIQSNSAVLLRDGLDYTMRQNDTLSLAMFEDQVWHEIGRSQANRFEVLTSDKTLEEGDTGSTIFLGHVDGIDITLPAPALGIHFTFIVSTAPTTAHTINTASGANLMSGTVLDIVGELVYATARDIMSFVASTSLIGDRCDIVSDGTNWYYKAFSGANGGITTGQT
jgi:hypothetical protein